MEIIRAHPPSVHNPFLTTPHVSNTSQFPYAVSDVANPIFYNSLPALVLAQQLLIDAADKILRAMDNGKGSEIEKVVLEYKIHPAREHAGLGMPLTENDLQLGEPIIAIFSRGHYRIISPISMRAILDYLIIVSNGAEAVRAVLLGLESIVRVAETSLEQVYSEVTDNRPTLDNINATHVIHLPASTGLSSTQQYEPGKIGLILGFGRFAYRYDPQSPIVKELTVPR